MAAASSSTLSFLLSFFLLSHLSFNLPDAPSGPFPTFNSPGAQFGSLLKCSDAQCKEAGETRFCNQSDRTHCGVSDFSCRDEIINIRFQDQGRLYFVKNISEEEKMLFVQDAELMNDDDDLCTRLQIFAAEPDFQPNYFEIASQKATFFRCKRDDDEIPEHCRRQSFNYTQCKFHVLYYFPQNKSPSCSMNKCETLKIPIMQELPTPSSSSPDWLDENLGPLLDKGFALGWKTPGCFTCHKRPPLSPGGSNEGLPWKLKKALIGVGAAVGSFIATCLVFVYWFYCICTKVSPKNPISFWKRKVKDVENVEEFLKNYGTLIPRRYPYSELKNITSSFKEKLGQGGYGSVFKGKLSDGRLVAVKVLDQSKGSGEEFINEVASIGRTYHVNVVALLGFCSQDFKRALVYEFMANGSLEKFIYSGKNHHLGWQKLCEIVLGIARGLEYLHRGCYTRILHFDIKPHNILLDKELCPKISDFGLAKLCPSKESTISLLGARGTIGYIAPEVYCRNFGGVSSKSDVYSYGMMVLEMVGGRRNINAEAENTSEIYFPDWIYMRLDMRGDLGLHNIQAEAEEEIARKMIMVGLWCIQTDPRDRPSMGKVVEMLEGNLESLPVPPKPFLYSPARPNQGSSTASLS